MPTRIGAVVIALLVATVATAWAQDLLHRPRPVDLEDGRCAKCGMRLAVLRHVAQLQTKDGRVLDFDDPGCLFRFLQERRPRVHARYFQGPGGRWIRGRDVAFLPDQRTPMGYGLAAVRAGTAGALSWDEAWRRVAARHRGQ